jgi:hypothetical protein
MIKFKSVFTVIGCLLLLFYSPVPAQASPGKTWTFMVYLDADNNLEGAGIDDFLEMATVGSDANINIVVQFDRIIGEDARYEDWTTTKRFYVTPGMTPTAANALADLGELNMGDPATLQNFINWAVGGYPAQNYALVLWNHGGGWRDRLESLKKSAASGMDDLNQPIYNAVCWDDTNGDDSLYMKEVRTALDGADYDVDLLGFDACLMGMLEVAYEIRNTGPGIMVGSEETEPGDGWPYDTILADLAVNYTMTPAQLGSVIVDRYYASYSNDFTQAAVDLTRIGALATDVSTLAATLNSSWDTDRPAVEAAARNVMDAVDLAVINEQHGISWPGTNGLSIYFPLVSGLLDADYNGTNIYFPADTAWDEFLDTFYAAMDKSWVYYARQISQQYDYPEYVDLYDFCDHLLAPTPSDLTWLQLDLQTDDYGGETYWKVKNSGGQFFAGCGNYGSNTLYITDIGLAPGDYTFTITDAYGDGICCLEGNGYYTLSNPATSEVLADGGDFGSGESTPFTIIAPPPEEEAPANLIDWSGNLVADFGANGMWYHDGTSWHWMTNDGDVGEMVVWDGKLVVDFGAGKGMYYYDGSWHWMTNKSDPNLMTAWDNGTTEVLVVDFGSGERIYTYDGAWHWFNNKDGVADMAVWSDKLIVDFGFGRGVYNYDTAWHWMTNKDDVAMMLPWDNGTTEVLVVDFGGGRRMYTYNGAWNWFTNKDDVNDMAVWNGKLVVDFGAGRTLQYYDTSWHWLSNKDEVSRMVAWRGGSDLAVDFGSGRNMYNYDGTWAWIKNANDVPEMLAWGNRLAVDFGTGVGVYNYNGSWHQMKPWSTAD